jgi:hypothetical protein
MNSAFPRTLAVLLSVACAGCVTSASVPKGAAFGPDFAEATFEMGVKDSVGFGHATNQEYRVGEVARIEDADVVKIFTWAAKKPKPFLLQAGKEVTVFAKMDRTTGAPGITSTTDNWCINASRFTPAPATRYRVVQKGSAFGSCELTVVEAQSGRVPDGLEVILFPSSDGRQQGAP